MVCFEGVNRFYSDALRQRLTHFLLTLTHEMMRAHGEDSAVFQVLQVAMIARVNDNAATCKGGENIGG